MKVEQRNSIFSEPILMNRIIKANLFQGEGVFISVMLVYSNPLVYNIN